MRAGGSRRAWVLCVLLLAGCGSAAPRATPAAPASSTAAPATRDCSVNQDGEEGILVESMYVTGPTCGAGFALAALFFRDDTPCIEDRGGGDVRFLRTCTVDGYRCVRSGRDDGPVRCRGPEGRVEFTEAAPFP